MRQSRISPWTWPVKCGVQQPVAKGDAREGVPSWVCWWWGRTLITACTIDLVQLTNWVMRNISSWVAVHRLLLALKKTEVVILTRKRITIILPLSSKCWWYDSRDKAYGKIFRCHDEYKNEILWAEHAIWIGRKYGKDWFYLMQFLSSYGYFQSYLHRMGRVTSPPSCLYCLGTINDTEYTIFTCEKWAQQRRCLVPVIGLIEPNNIIETMIHKEEA